MNKKVKVTVPVLMLRSEPSPDGTVLTELAAGTELELVEWKRPYALVRYRSASRELEGWAAVSMLSGESQSGGMRKKCPMCGGCEWKELHAGVQSSAYFFAPVHLGKGIALSGDGDQLDLRACVCLACGHVRWFVPAGDLRKL